MFLSLIQVAQSDSLWPHGLYSPPGSSAHGIFQARMLEWVSISFSRGSSQPRDWTQVSRTSGRCFTREATREAHLSHYLMEFVTSRSGLTSEDLRLLVIPWNLIHSTWSTGLTHYILKDWTTNCVQVTKSVWLLTCVQLFATPRTAAGQASLSIQLPELTSTESVKPSNHLILRHLVNKTHYFLL